jgi:hypothetical protein
MSTEKELGLEKSDMDVENLPFDTGSKPGMGFREIILWMAKDHPDRLTDILTDIMLNYKRDSGALAIKLIEELRKGASKECVLGLWEKREHL